MKLLLQRATPLKDASVFPARITTFGTLYEVRQGNLLAEICRTLEDGILEDPLEQIANWKIAGRCAIPAGEYEIGLQDSPRFGVDSPTLLNVPGYAHVRMHSGEDIDDTEGCIIVGDEIDQANFTISGGLARGVLRRLRAKLQDAIRGRHENVTLEVRNPEP